MGGVIRRGGGGLEDLGRRENVAAVPLFRASLQGGAGNDTLDGGGGGDTLRGGSGDDRLTTDAGVSFVDGGDGVDVWQGDLSGAGQALAFDAIAP